MAWRSKVFSFQSIAIKRAGSLETTMHPLGMYLVIKDGQREHGWAVGNERHASYARVDATPILTPEPVSRITRLAAIVRRRVMRTAGA